MMTMMDLMNWLEFSTVLRYRRILLTLTAASSPLLILSAQTTMSSFVYI